MSSIDHGHNRLGKNSHSVGSFKKRLHIEQIITEQEIVNIINSILTEKGSLTPEALFSELYMRYVPIVYHRIMSISSDETQIKEMLKEVSEIEILDSEKQQKLTKYFDFNEGFWSIKEDSNG